jgi:hypothetical protein
MAGGNDIKLRDSIRRLTGVDPDTGVKLPPAATPGAIPANTNTTPPPTGRPNTGGGGGGGGIASPLVETAYADREFYSMPWKTSDGLFSMPVIKTIKLKDANDKPVEIQIKAPPGVTE